MSQSRWNTVRNNVGMENDPHATAFRRRGVSDLGPISRGSVLTTTSEAQADRINMAADDSSGDEDAQPFTTSRSSSGADSFRGALSTSTRGAIRRGSVVLDALFRFGTTILQRTDSNNNHESTSSGTQDFVKNAVLGEIQFHQGVTQYCITKPQVQASEIFEHLLFSESAWDLYVPKLVLSVMGGAGKMDMEPEDVASFSKGLVEAALKTSAWVITGGTKSGVMDMVGKAMQEYDKYHQVPCIGITAYGALTSQWRTLLEHAQKSSPHLDGSETPSSPLKDQHRLDWREQVDASDVEGQTDGSKDETSGKMIPLPEIQDNHTHMLLVNNGVAGHKAFASEADLRARLEEFAGTDQSEALAPQERPEQPKPERAISDTTSSSSQGRHENYKQEKPQKMGRQRSSLAYDPREQRKKLVDFNKTEVPRVMILVNGGKFSLDHLEKAIKHDCPLVVCKGTGRLADCIVTLCESFNEAEIANREQALSDAQEKALSFLKPDTLNEAQKAMLDRIVKSELVEIFFSKKERLEDVILRAVIEKKKQGAVLHLLLLAVEWRCTDQLGPICRRFMEEHGSHPDDRKAAISHLFHTMIETCSPAARARAPVGSDLGSGWGPVVTWLMKNHRKDLESFDLDASEIKWRGLGRPLWTGPEALFIWAIEKEAPESVIEAIWMNIEEPVHACLVGASVCRQTIQDAHYSGGSYKHSKAQERLNAIAERFEKVAKILIQDVAVTRGDPIMYLFKSSEKRWEGKDCFTLAHTLECKLFVSSGFYKNAVDLYWMTPAPFDVTKKPLDPSFLRWQKLLAGLVCETFAWFSPGKSQDDQEVTHLYSVPIVMALTHGLSRVMFIITYSLAVFTGNLADGNLSMWELVLFLWGLGYALVEVKQWWKKPSFTEYIMDLWNFLDSLIVSVLLVALSATALFGDKAKTVSSLEYSCELFHAMNLLPSYLRALQSFQLSAYFGILLKTVLRMCKDALYFFGLLVVFCLAFSSALTPLLWENTDQRWEQGVLWAFWSIFGEVDDAKKQIEHVKPWQLRYLVHSLLYLLSLVSSTLLANLLIALMNNTYEETRNNSELEWIFNRVDAVLEFNEGADFPPPLNLLQWLWETCGWTRSYGNPPAVKKQRSVGCSSKYLQDAQIKAMQLAKREEEESEDKLSTRSLQAPMDDRERLATDAEAETCEQRLLRQTENIVQELRTSLKTERDELQTERDALKTERDELKRRVAELESAAGEQDNERSRVAGDSEMQEEKASVQVSAASARNSTLPAPLDAIQEQEPLSRTQGYVDPLPWTPKEATSEVSGGQ